MGSIRLSLFLEPFYCLLLSFFSTFWAHFFPVLFENEIHESHACPFLASHLLDFVLIPHAHPPRQVASSVDAALKTPDCLLNPDDPLSSGPGSPLGGGGSRQSTPNYGNSRQGSRTHSKDHAAGMVPFDSGGGKEPATGGSSRSPRTANGHHGGALEPSSARSAGSGKGVGSGPGPGEDAAAGGGEKPSNEAEFTPAAVLALQRANRVLSSPELLQGLLVAERAVMQDAFMGAHLR